jgi:hypothetical protein
LALLGHPGRVTARQVSKEVRPRRPLAFSKARADSGRTLSLGGLAGDSYTDFVVLRCDVSAGAVGPNIWEVKISKEVRDAVALLSGIDDRDDDDRALIRIDTAYR